MTGEDRIQKLTLMISALLRLPISILSIQVRSLCLSRYRRKNHIFRKRELLDILISFNMVCHLFTDYVMNFIYFE